MDPRVWVVTGCSSGIGRAIVEQVLHTTSDLVVATVRKEGTLTQLAAEFGDRLHECVLDVTDPAGRETLATFVSERYGRLDVLINNAGIATMGAALDLPESEMRRVFETNFFAVTALSQWAGKLMVARQRGVLIQISSTAGVMGFAANGAYSASKFALEGFSEVLAEELRSFGVRVHIVELGNCETGFFGHNYRAVASPHGTDSVHLALEFFDSRSEGASASALTPLEVAGAVVQLAEDPEAPMRLMIGTEALQTAMAKADLLTDDHARSMTFQEKLSGGAGSTIQL